MHEQITANARVGALTLAIFAPLHCLIALAGTMFSPMALVCWFGVSFGILCLCDELGTKKPLNRVGSVLFAAAFCARLLMTLAVDPALYVRAELLFAFATMGALLFWSLAVAHRPQAPRTVGIFGMAISGSTIVVILASHLLMGSATIWGFGALFAALSDPTLDTRGAITTVNAILALWGLVMAGLMWTRSLRSTTT